MATSFSLTKTVANITEEALRDARIIPAEQSVQNVDSQNGLTALNNVLKFWQTQGVHLWNLKRAVLPLVADKQSYLLGPSGDECGEEDTFYNTTLDAAEASGQTTLSVASTTNMAANQDIGIELDDGTRQWTTISSVGSGEVTVNASLTGDAASGNTVFFYSDQIERPLKIDNITYASSISSSEIPVEKWSRDEYMEQPVKTSSGTVTGAYYNPILTNGKLFVWQVANKVTNILRFDYREPITVYGSTSDQLVIPEEFFLALKWSLAAELGPSYGVPQARQTVLEGKAEKTLDDALNYDAELGSMFIRPDFS